MNTQGPFDLTLNQLLPLNDPGATSNNPATAVQIQNASPFIVEVNSGGIVLTIQSFTAQTVPTSGGGQQMSVTPMQSGGNAQQTSPKSLTAVWLLAGESSPMLDGPLTAAAIESTLGSQGIAGVSLLTIAFPCASGAFIDFAAHGLAAGTYRLWNWGWFQPTSSSAPPTKGTLILNPANGSNGADDSLTYLQGSSNRLAGMVFVIGGPSSGFCAFTNNTDQTVEAFITFSAA